VIGGKRERILKMRNKRCLFYRVVWRNGSVAYYDNNRFKSIKKCTILNKSISCYSKHVLAYTLYNDVKIPVRQK